MHTNDDLDYVSQQLVMLNKTCYREGLSALGNRFEIADFHRRRRRIPVQDFPWLEVREVPGIGGRGVFAKVKLPKNSVVCDYSGQVVDSDEWKKWRPMLSEEERAHVDNYIVEFSGHFRSVVYNRAVLAHEPMYGGTVVLGRLINHSSIHPNLSYTVHRSGRDVLETYISFKAVRDIDAGEQLLWHYGRDYDQTRLRGKCICNRCDPKIAEESTPALKRAPPQIVVEGPWNGQPSLSQELHGKNGVRPPLSISELLLSAAHKANATGFLLEHYGGEALAAYERSRKIVSGVQEPFIAGLESPVGGNNLWRLFWAASKDFFERGNSVIIMLMKTRSDYRPLVVLLGKSNAADSNVRYGCIAAYIGSEENVYAVVDQTPAEGELPTIEEQYKRGTLLQFAEVTDEPWSEILRNTDIELAEVTRLLLRHHRAQT